MPESCKPGNFKEHSSYSILESWNHDFFGVAMDQKSAASCAAANASLSWSPERNQPRRFWLGLEHAAPKGELTNETCLDATFKHILKILENIIETNKNMTKTI